MSSTPPDAHLATPELRSGGWAPGWYMQTCRTCATKHMAAKGAWNCITCAAKEYEQRRQAQIEMSAQL